MVRAAAQKWKGPIDFLSSPGGGQMLQNHPQLREVLIYDKRGTDRGLRGLMRLAKQLRARNYARVICSHRSLRTAWLLRLTAIPVRIGFDNAAAAWCYTERIPYPRQKHEVERCLALLGGGAWQRPRMYPTAAERRVAQRKVGATPYLVVAPGSIWATKRWPITHFARVVRTLLDDRTTVVLMGGAEDRALAQELLELAGVGSGLINLVGQTNLRESYAVLENAACLLTNDSAPMHMGVAAGIPVVALFCSTVPAMGFAPQGPQDVVLEVNGLDCRPCGAHGHPQCPRQHFRCGLDLSPEQVLVALRQRLPVRQNGS